jgi:hypothetical protein
LRSLRVIFTLFLLSLGVDMPNNSSGGGIVGVAVTAAITGGVGSFFAPASAAAAGGTLNVMAACAIGGVIMSIPAGVFVGLTGFAAIAAFATDNKLLGLGLGALTVAELVGASLLAAEIGAACLGVAAHPVFVCSLVGSLALATPILVVGLAVVMGLAVCCCAAASIESSAIPGQHPFSMR